MVWSYSGVRPLYDDGASKAQEATRDYVLKAVGGEGEPQMLNVFGGKITTYRKLAESCSKRSRRVLGAKGKPWTEGATLPGRRFRPQRLWRTGVAAADRKSPGCRARSPKVSCAFTAPRFAITKSAAA